MLETWQILPKGEGRFKFDERAVGNIIHVCSDAALSGAAEARNDNVLSNAITDATCVQFWQAERNSHVMNDKGSTVMYPGHVTVEITWVNQCTQ